MAKKGWGKLVALAAVSGAVAAGVSYVLQYKTYHKELEKDFREFEEDEDSELKKDGSEDSTFESAKVNRNYISLTSRYECKSNNHRKPANSHVPL